MPEFNLDHIKSLNAKEVRGVVRNLTRMAQIVFTPAEIVQHRSQDILDLALQMCDAQGIVYMSVLGQIQNVANRFAAMVLVNRTPAVAEGDPCVVEVTLEYEHIMDGNNQILRDPPSGLLYGKGKTSIREKDTNFFYPDGVRDPAKKTQIIVAHQFPTEDTTVPTSAYNKLYPRTVFQGGKVKLSFPESTYQLSGLFLTKAPTLIAELMVASINEKTWLGKDPGTWICSECAWEINNPGESLTVIPTYKMTFDFHNNPDGWNPEVVFLDQRNGAPPADVVEATEADENGVMRLMLILAPTDGDPGLSWNYTKVPAGLWRVPALYKIDFDYFFGSLFEGEVPRGL